MLPKILFTTVMDGLDRHAAEMAPEGFELVIAPQFTPAYTAALPEAEYLVGNVHGMDDGFYRTASRLKLVQLLSAGYDHVDLEAARRAAVPVCNNGGANSRAVAEHTILLILAVYRRLILQHDLTSKGLWLGNKPMPTFHEMHGRTLGIIGLGTIGKRVARIAGRGFDMKVQYNDLVRLGEDEEDSRNVRYRLLPELLATSDIVSCHVPLTSLTRNMINARTLAQMQPHAILINCGRGPVVDLAALHEALTTGRIAGAGLDVFPQEPPPADEPVLSLDNVVLSPHLAGASRETRIRQTRNGFDNVLRVARGERPLWLLPELRDMVA
ncbi:2-hydroxyacid dehydrogenase [Reyranella sp.]|uniref:2-hydroxyacid dehydrogenase n=1 Tax=Reyranella sp. TaxID=1929291 RepID=UPI003BAD5BF4